MRILIFPSLARAHKHMRLENVRDFPQTKLDREVNAPFLLNKHGHLFFLLHKNVVQIILFILTKNIKNCRKENKI